MIVWRKNYITLFPDCRNPDEEILQGESCWENWIPKRWSAGHKEAPLVPGELDVTQHITDTYLIASYELLTDRSDRQHTSADN